MFFAKLATYALAATFAATSTLAFADEEEGALEEARLFFELNDTDGDLGIHGKFDGDEWEELEIESPSGREILEVKVKSALKYQGMTELFFESAEPTFDELPPAEFFERFPEGWYEIEAETLEGDELENEVYLSHVIPAAPSMVTITGVDEGIAYDAAANCDVALPEVDPTGGVTINWAPVTKSHLTLGTPTNTLLSSLGVEGVSVLYYEVVVEIDESAFKTSAFVPANITEWTFSEEFFDLSEEDEYKFEILARINIIDENGDVVTVEVEVDEGPPAVVVDVDVPGNKSAVESCFEVD